MYIEIKLQNQFYLLAETVCAGDQRLISNRASLQETMYEFFFAIKVNGIRLMQITCYESIKDKLDSKSNTKKITRRRNLTIDNQSGFMDSSTY